jgi:hypothetical protein
MAFILPDLHFISANTEQQQNSNLKKHESQVNRCCQWHNMKHIWSVSSVVAEEPLRPTTHLEDWNFQLHALTSGKERLIFQWLMISPAMGT